MPDSIPVLAPGEGPVEVIDGVHLSTLDNGVRVITEAMPDVRSATIGYWIGVGSRDEDAPAEGASHFLEHLLFKGTSRRSAAEIAEAIDAVGGDMNAFTSKESTCFYARVLDRDLDLATDVLGDLICDAQIRATDVDAERQVVLEEISMHMDTPDDLVHSLFAQLAFGDHPLGKEILGTETSITDMARDVVAGHFAHHYIPRNLVVAAAGNLDHAEVVASVDRSLQGLRTADEPTIHRAVPLAVPARAEVWHRPVEQAQVIVGGAGIPRGDDRRFAARVLDQAFGGGMASRLFQEVRERRGLAYSVFSYASSFDDSGTFGVYAGTTPRKVGEVLDVVRDQLDALRTHGLTGPELTRAKGHLAGAMLLALEDTGSRMSRIGRATLSDGPLLSLDETAAAIDAVDHDAITEVAEVLVGGPRSLAMVGPESLGDATDHASAAGLADAA